MGCCACLARVRGASLPRVGAWGVGLVSRSGCRGGPRWGRRPLDRTLRAGRRTGAWLGVLVDRSPSPPRPLPTGICRQLHGGFVRKLRNFCELPSRCPTCLSPSGCAGRNGSGIVRPRMEQCSTPPIFPATSSLARGSWTSPTLARARPRCWWRWRLRGCARLASTCPRAAGRSRRTASTKCWPGVGGGRTVATTRLSPGW